MRRLAFTLVELLVVISIIAILLTLMAPAARSLVQRTEMDICQSNLHHFGVANGHRYVANADFYLCPTFKTVCAPNAVRSYVMQHSFNTTEGWPGGQPWGNGYSLNKLSDVKDPARLMLLSEEATWMVQANGVWYSRFTVNDAHMCCSDWPNRDTIAQFHYPGPGPIDQQIEGKGNVAFVDGHVGAVVTTQTPYVVCQTWYEDPVKAANSGL